MRLNYNGVELLLTRTVQYEMTTEYDATGLDALYQVVTLGSAFILNPFATATNKAPSGQTGLGLIGIPGERLGPSIVRLQDLLSVPRARLRLWSGNDLLYDVPDRVDLTNSYRSDPIGGPLPQEVKVERVCGDKTAWGLFRVKFASQSCDKTVLSHRWSVSTETDEAGFTSRTIEGHAVFNLQFMQSVADEPRILADSFRMAFGHTCPAGFRRKRVRVFVTPDGRELSYFIEDAEQALNIGPLRLVFKIAGSATAGVEWPLKDIKAVGSAIGTTFPDIVGRVLAGDLRDAIGAGVAAAWSHLIPRQQTNCIVQVYGSAGADRNQLAFYAARVAMDRVGPSLAAGISRIISAYLTSSHDSDGLPFVEVRMEILGLSVRAFEAWFDPAGGPTRQISLSGTIDGVATGAPLPQPIRDDKDYPNPPFPSSGGMRGRYTGALVTQVIQRAADVCEEYLYPSEVPGIDGDAVDVTVED